VTSDRLDDLPEAFVRRLDRLHRGRNRARVADHVGVREVHDREAVPVLLELGDEARRHLAGGHLRLVVIARDFTRRRDEDSSLATPFRLASAVEEVRDVCVLLSLRDV
jgi:hypothetical protein